VTSSSANGFKPDSAIMGPKDGRARILHTMLRVTDLETAVRFYVEGLGMQVLARVEIEARNATAVFVGFDGEDAGAPVELTRYWDEQRPYTHGTGYGHVAVGVTDVPAAFARLEALGAEIIMRPGTMVPDGPCCAFVRDPDGYAVELVEP
jgi:lactoylglutathione lyase